MNQFQPLKREHRDYLFDSHSKSCESSYNRNWLNIKGIIITDTIYNSTCFLELSTAI